MRIIRFLLTFSIVVIIFGVLTTLIAREVMLFVGVNQVKNSLKLARKHSLKGSYTNECLTMGSIIRPDESLMTFQVRFIGDNEYVTEVVCNQFPLSPIEIEQVALKPFIVKEPGKSGVVFGEELSGVVLEVLGRKALVFVENEEIGSSYGDVAESAIQAGPVTSCEGFGFSCCEDDYEQGNGDQLLGVTNCPKSCFATCEQRPVVLSFNSSPFYDPRTREVTINSGQMVTFSYVVSDNQTDSFEETGGVDSIVYALLTFLEGFLSDGSSVSVKGGTKAVLSFGDGRQTQFNDLQGSADHVYTCGTGRCIYNAEVIATNGNDISSADNLLGKITIVVQN